jgi:hypothetical protein
MEDAFPCLDCEVNFQSCVKWVPGLSIANIEVGIHYKSTGGSKTPINDIFEELVYFTQRLNESTLKEICDDSMKCYMCAETKPLRFGRRSGYLGKRGIYFSANVTAMDSEFALNTVHIDSIEALMKKAIMDHYESKK